MDNFKLLSTLQTYCATNGLGFLAGSDPYQNYEASEIDFSPGQIVIGADFVATPSYSQYNVVDEIRYQGVIALGRKFETSATKSELDETFIQKVTRRLEDLTELLDFHLRAFACLNELQITGANFDYKLNEFDTNIDFVTASITFIQ